MASRASEKDSSDHQKPTNSDSANISEHTTSVYLKRSSTYAEPCESSANLQSEVRKTQSTSSSSDVSTKKSLNKVWTLNSEYSVPLRQFHEAFDHTVDTIVDLVKNRFCNRCASGCNGGALQQEEVFSPLPPLTVPILQNSSFLRAAQRGEGHALLHLLAIGARADCTDSEKRNAVHLACIGGWDDCVFILLDLKAISRTKGRVTASSWDPKTDFEAVDIYSKTPLDYAKEKDPNSACVTYIESAIEFQYNKRVRKAKKKL